MKKLAIVLLTTGALASTSLAGGHEAKPAEKDIVGVAAANESFTTLVAAVKAAGLVEALQGEGPFTVFAPTNEAFAALPEGTLETLLKPENKEQLTNILLYHVVPAKVMAADVKAMEAPTLLEGQTITVTVDDGVMVDQAKVVATDVKASNGVIHVIDAVILPDAG
ncbi:MAG: fasciclin domain-containing protein [Verrucomicrobiota bacterium]